MKDTLYEQDVTYIDTYELPKYPIIGTLIIAIVVFYSLLFIAIMF